MNMTLNNDITLVLCVDKNHIDELKFAWKTWAAFQPEITNLKNKILIYDEEISEDIRKHLDFIDDSFVLHKFVNKKYYSSQRDAMLTAWFEGFKLVKTPFYLKIDTDCYATKHNNKWIQMINDRYKHVFISNPWGYTKNAERISTLEKWSETISIFDDEPKLNLTVNQNNTIIHSRIISFIFIGNTEWTNNMSKFCWKDNHFELPVASHDTFLWYCAARGNYNYKTVKFKKYGFIHTRLKKGMLSIRFDNDLIKLHIGCGRKKYENWWNTDKNILDIVEENSWYKNNIKENSIHRILAEHVFEHLSDKNRRLAILNFKKFLNKENGSIRIAVPDGFHPDKDYIENVKVKGIGKSAYDHKFLYNYQTLISLFKEYGFNYKLLEYFDEHNNFHYFDWNIEDGFIKRSSKFDRRNRKKPLSYTSLIIDFFI